MLRSGRMNRSQKESIDSLPIGWTVGAMIYFTGEVSVQVQMARAPGKRIEEASNYFMHAPLGSGDIAELRTKRVPLKDSTETKMGYQERRGGRMGSWSDLLDALSPFNPLSEMRQKKRKENPWTDPIIFTP
ncbi:hypothetical protein H5410_027508 [Solanum commersonii]|uniref:Uncharacterized protein n=1 Tax=Solanum commersonii TaxID=4109 RepID=A0A9J5Z220_SOLCO|nr:hypothetical protein H5410_027508 [Solanum commersonii]